MAQPPVPEVQFEVIRGPRRSTRRALWFSVVVVFFLAASAPETFSRDALAIFCVVAAFTWPVLNTYFPWVDRTWGAHAKDFADRKEVDKLASLSYPAAPFRRSLVTFATLWISLGVAWSIQPGEAPIIWWQRIGVVVAATLIWPLLCRIHDGFARASNYVPATKDEGALAVLLLGVTAFLFFTLWASSR